MWSRTACAEEGPTPNLHQAEASDLIAWVLDEAQHCEDVLNMCRVEKFESTKLHERHVATDYLKRSTMI
jgi:hypothetical protein